MKEWDNLERAEPAESEGHKSLSCLVLTSLLSEVPLTRIRHAVSKEMEKCLGHSMWWQVVRKIYIYI
jgi:hypothetical protein